MSEREGPERTVRVMFSCHGCKWRTFERYVAQGDSGIDDFCTKFEPKKVIPNYDTPSWCPFRRSGDDKVVEAGHCKDWSGITPRS